MTRKYIIVADDSLKGFDEGIEKLERKWGAEEIEPCEDCVSREAVENAIKHAEVNFTVNSAIDFTKHKREVHEIVDGIVDAQIKALRALPSVTPQPKVGRCKDCKYFEYDSVAKVDGIPLIVAHEICKKWGDGCKTKEDGYCFLFEEVGDEK